MIDYSDMTYDQKNIMALRNAVMFIASVLSDEQKSHLEMLTSNVDEKLDGAFDATQAEVMKDIYKITQEILSLRPEN
ncbi:hypothetical protein MZUP3_170 [Erwinia phage vB_EhrS_49]|uniref:Uncharacterized protein n=1 Tax=Erwinia phage vB_EhrS_49 TaxID=2283026 RepID=A0A4Y1NRT4_9CAUD|nr:hypothetical protein HOV54_gp17 [Erwinia phage vB_EhrS_49]AXH43446.1 hypothetical protein MZUP3_170 [Erwinia phage vB_EhrS_49]